MFKQQPDAIFLLAQLITIYQSGYDVQWKEQLERCELLTIA